MSRRISLTAAFSFTFLCIDIALAKDCDFPDDENHRSPCTAYEIAALSVWTELQCMDECLRLPQCDKYIFRAEGSHNCKLLKTRDHINIGQNLAQYNSCAPENVTFWRKFLLGTKDCPELQRNEKPMTDGIAETLN